MFWGVRTVVLRHGAVPESGLSFSLLEPEPRLGPGSWAWGSVLELGHWLGPGAWAWAWGSGLGWSLGLGFGA